MRDNAVAVITRPEPENSELCQLLAQYSIKTASLPMTIFTPTPISSEIKSQLLPLDQWDGIISISPRASKSGIALINQLMQKAPGTNPTIYFQKQLSWVAIGHASANVLKQHGISHVSTPEHGIDSEGLLQIDCLQNIRNQNWLLLSGNDGRTLIHDTLLNRRCTRVLKLVCYQRSIVEYSEPELYNALCPLGKTKTHATNQKVIIATSVTIVKHLTECYQKLLTNDKLDSLLKVMPLIVVGPRQKAQANLLGWQTVIQSNSAHNQDLARSIIQWFDTPR